MNILVADDDPLMTILLSSNLKKAGYTVVVARDAMQAIMLALREPPDAVLLDVMMPGGSGLQVLRQLKNSFKTAMIPIIVISGSIDANTILQVQELGADHYMPKPPDIPRLLATLQELLATASAKK